MDSINVIKLCNRTLTHWPLRIIHQESTIWSNLYNQKLQNAWIPYYLVISVEVSSLVKLSWIHHRKCLKSALESCNLCIKLRACRFLTAEWGDRATYTESAGSSLSIWTHILRKGKPRGWFNWRLSVSTPYKGNTVTRFITYKS